MATALITDADLIAHLGNNGQAALIQMTDPANTAIDTALTAKAREHAADVTYSYIDGVVTIPLTPPVPPILTKINCCIAIYWLWAGDERPKRVESDNEWALKMLKDFRAGNVSLGLAGDGTDSIEQSSGEVQFVSSPSVFGRESLESY